MFSAIRTSSSYPGRLEQPSFQFCAEKDKLSLLRVDIEGRAPASEHIHLMPDCLIEVSSLILHLASHLREIYAHLQLEYQLPVSNASFRDISQPRDVSSFRHAL